MRKVLLGLFLSLLVGIAIGQPMEIYKDAKRPVEERVKDLLSRLTPEEKISLLIATSPGIERMEIGPYRHGNEALHGVVRPGKFTVFPQAIGLAATWNPALLYEVTTAISDEARGRWNELEQGKKIDGPFSDLLTFWSPTVNMARDPRWGRTPETYGEDPFLSGTLGVAFVKGLQGNHPRYLKAVSTPKHFVANNEEHNRAYCNAVMSERTLREYYLPAFERCIVDGKAASIMMAYNAINGVPCIVNNYLIRKVLREDWGFRGYIVSDCYAPNWLVEYHKYVKTFEAAATLAIKAGLDLECGDQVYREPLLNAYRQYMVTDAEIDSAAFRVLRARMKLGMFDDPELNPYNQISPQIVGCKKHQDLALETARQSLVLLKNEKNFLPLNLKKLKSVAVVGINAGQCVFGDYSGDPANPPVSILDGIKNMAGNQVEVRYAPWVSAVDGMEMITAEYFPEGLKAEYYSNTGLQGVPKVRTDACIHFDPENQAPDPFLPQAPLSVRWSGKLKAPVSGKYTLSLKTDDGCRLFLDGKCLIDSWHDRSATADQVVVNFEAGKGYELIVEYYDGGGESVAALYWRAPEIDKKSRLALFGDAGKVVKGSDVVIAVMGISTSLEMEGKDRNSIELPADQQEFLKEIYKLNPNIVVVLVAGSSLAVNWENEHVPAILNAWYPGEQGGIAVAEALFGKYNPGGRLPLTYYNSLNELPAFDDYEIRKGRTYQYFTGKPLYEFGYGLSYTRFKYDRLKVENGQDSVYVSFRLTNTGRYDGDEVSQVYITFPNTGVQMPLKQLKGFQRNSLKRGTSRQVCIPVPKREFRYWDEASRQFVSPEGPYLIQVGSSSADIRMKQEVNLLK